MPRSEPSVYVQNYGSELRPFGRQCSAETGMAEGMLQGKAKAITMSDLKF